MRYAILSFFENYYNLL